VVAARKGGLEGFDEFITEAGCDGIPLDAVIAFK
jgi:hypothetical protein